MGEGQNSLCNFQHEGVKTVQQILKGRGDADTISKRIERHPVFYLKEGEKIHDIYRKFYKGL